MHDLENFYIPLSPYQKDEELNQNIEALNFLLKSSGAKAEVIVDDDSHVKVVLLKVSCKIEDYSRIAKRRAGRPEVFKDKMTIGEALNLRADHTMEEIAQMAGISRRTLFRKLKKYKNMPGMSL